MVFLFDLMYHVLIFVTRVFCTPSSDGVLFFKAYSNVLLAPIALVSRPSFSPLALSYVS